MTSICNSRSDTFNMCLLWDFYDIQILSATRNFMYKMPVSSARNSWKIQEHFPVVDFLTFASGELSAVSRWYFIWRLQRDWFWASSAVPSAMQRSFKNVFLDQPWQPRESKIKGNEHNHSDHMINPTPETRVSADRRA